MKIEKIFHSGVRRLHRDNEILKKVCPEKGDQGGGGQFRFQELLKIRSEIESFVANTWSW